MTNIPEDPKLKNPSKTDNLIAANETEEANDTNAELPNFNATDIDATGSINSGIFVIKGQPQKDIVKDYVFNITLVTGEKAICKLPKSTKNTEVRIECELDGTLEKTILMIPETTVKSGYKEIFNLNKIKSKRAVSCANGKLKKINKKKDNKISFRQISGFKPEGKNIKFIFTAFILDSMKKGNSINMNVTLNKGNNIFTSQTAKCTLNKDVASSLGASESFECTIENVENATEYKGLELVDSEDVSGIPNNPNMTNTSVVDDLIESGEIKNLSLEENKNNIPPVFNLSSIDGLGCRSSGAFFIKGLSNKKVDKSFRFNLPLSYPLIDAKCTVPEINKTGEEIEIVCQTKSSFTKSKIVIEPLTVSKNNSEVISLSSASSNDEISCENYQAVSLKKKRKKFKAPFSFRQTQKFENKNGVINFILYVLKKAEAASIPKNLEIKVRPVIGNGRRRLDSGDDLTPVNMDCTAASTDDDPVKLSCSGKADPSASGLVILDSEDISGIPLDENSANPKLVDELINEKIVVDCSSERCSLPEFTNGKFDDLSSTFYINGEIKNGDKVNNSVFNLSIFPDSYGDCQINTDTGKIECYNKEEIDDSLVLIEETVVKSSNGTDLFLLKGGVKSESDDISLLASDLEHLVPNNGSEPLTPESSTPTSSPTSSPTSTPNNSTTPISSVKNFFNKASEDRGLSGGAIAGIVIACAVALIAALGIAYIIKTREKIEPSQQIETIQLGNSNDIGTSVGHFNSTNV